MNLQNLHRLARAATDAGHYNIAGLFAAAAASLINTQLYADSLPKTDAELAAAIAEIEPALAEAGTDAGLLDSLRRVRAALAEGRMVLRADAPPARVCRVCGQVAHGELPDFCPRCGAGKLVFQGFSAVFYLEPEPPALVLEQLAATPDWLEHMLDGLTDEQAARNVGGVEGEWSLREAAGHLLDAQQLIAGRVTLFLEQEAPQLSAKAVWEMVNSARLSPAEIAAQFRRWREAKLADLWGATPAHWARVGQHAEFGPVTLQQQATYFAKHEHWHRAQMTRIRREL